MLWMQPLAVRPRFQSSPTSKGGRYGLSSQESISRRLFQSSPTSKGGRYTPQREAGREISFVSILAHLERWALRCCGCSHWLCGRGFNPRPPRKVGATLTGLSHRPAVAVSILAHLERWALRAEQPGVDLSALVSILAHLERWALHAAARGRPRDQLCFNPRPPRKVGATYPLKGEKPESIGFNPRPPRKVGATSCAKRIGWCTYSFNPRPPRKVGATRRLLIRQHRRRVSILAHLERWALRQRVVIQCADGSVSILAHLERWALPAITVSGTGTRYVSILAHLERWALRSQWSWHTRRGRCFNPRPPRKVGATLWLTIEMDLPLKFQSSPTSKGGRYLDQIDWSRPKSTVSILAHLERWALRQLAHDDR